ncbi:MAG: LysR family transcriptional regulator [Dokdonella sp.]
MSRDYPAISIDQVSAFVELARTRSIRLAAEGLHLSEEGLRGRLLALEQRLGFSLYEKAQGRRSSVKLSPAGENFLDKATQFIEDARTLMAVADAGPQQKSLTIAAGQYITYYLLIDIVKAFNVCSKNLSIRLITRTEEQILAELQSANLYSIAICAPDVYPTSLLYQRWFSMGWRLVVPEDHPLKTESVVTLEQICEFPLIIFEPGSTGRQHVLEAFYARGLKPNIAMEATSTPIVVRMVEAGLGIAIIPVLPSGVVTRNLCVCEIDISDQIRPLETGIFIRPNARGADTVQMLASYLLGYPI